MADSVFPNPNLSTTFVNDHNQEAQAVWDAFHTEKSIRPPVGLGTSAQFFIFNHELNPNELVTFENYMSQAKVMLGFSLIAAVWQAH